MANLPFPLNEDISGNIFPFFSFRLVQAMRIYYLREACLNMMIKQTDF
jgi:hypothetical protein